MAIHIGGMGLCQYEDTKAVKLTQDLKPSNGKYKGQQFAIATLQLIPGYGVWVRHKRTENSALKGDLPGILT